MAVAGERAEMTAERSGRSRARWRRVRDRLLVHAIALVGLAGLVAGVYFAIVLGLGRRPTGDEGTLLVAAMAAAAVVALVYAATRERLTRFASRLVYGERPPPSDVLRAFGGRMTRALPLEEFLLQLAELLHRTLALTAAEVWTASAGMLERTGSDPERGRATLSITPPEEAVLARAGVCGPAWLQVWLPELLAGREGAELRIAPIVHSGELFGLIVAERQPDGEPFDDDEESALADLARQVGLMLRNVRLDSALQASLDELRRRAEELRASRARVVAAADAERRRIERDLHDGAQQHLMALAINLRLARELADSDPAQAAAVLEEVGNAVQEALDELRDLAHGIFPPLLADRGLCEALVAAARRAERGVRVDAQGVGRYEPEVEATVYFCCLEALQNVAKHAGDAACATVRIWEEEEGLRFEIADDGFGFDAAHRSHGAGLTNMTDRLGAIGGSLRVESAPGAGTRVLGAIPLPGRRS
jgi:signal transduction histidine kinase